MIQPIVRKAILLVVLLGVLVACERHRPRTLYTLGEAEKARDRGEGPLVSTVETRIDPNVLVPGKSVKVDFHVPGKTIVLELDPLSPDSRALPEGQHAWSARLPGGNRAFVMLIRGYVQARVRIDNTIYRLRSITPNTGILETFDANKFEESPNDAVVDPDATGGDAGIPGDSSCADPPDRIDVIVFYTAAALNAAGGDEAFETEIDFAIGQTNDAYILSEVTHYLNLLHTELVSYTEPLGGVDSWALHGQLVAPKDQVLDPIHGRRDSELADLVVLIYENGDNWCGWGSFVETAVAEPPEVATDDKAFSVVERDCAANHLSFAHEIGHNLGANHNRAAAWEGTLGYNFGHLQPVPSDTLTRWRTIMSLNPPSCKTDSSTCLARIEAFSNPNVKWVDDATGDPTGVATTKLNPEHNVKVFELNREQVTRYRYRCRGSQAAANVWMKDLWEDEGGEPDPATAGQAMWQSPYIWVRRSKDADLEHEYDHEDPTQGQTNHVYVKLDNTGGTSESAKLELYFANASTNLNDPGSWTLIDSQPHTIEPGGEVAEFEWSGISASGHYCLLARWNIDRTPLAFTSLDDAVRADNDLIWRNVNVIDLGGPPETNAVFAMAGDQRAPETYLLVTTKPMSRHRIDWAQLARASITIDTDKLDSQRLRVAGLRRTDRDEFEFELGDEVKLIGPFVLRPYERTRVELTTIANPEAVKKESARLANPAHYDVTVLQVRPEGVPLAGNPSALFQTRGLVLGGVSYTLRIPAGQ